MGMEYETEDDFGLDDATLAWNQPKGPRAGERKLSSATARGCLRRPSLAHGPEPDAPPCPGCGDPAPMTPPCQRPRVGVQAILGGYREADRL